MTSGIEKVKSCSCELYFLEMFLSAWHKNGKSSAVFSDISILFDFIKSPQGTENYSEPSTLLILNVLNNSFALFCSVLKKLFPAQREDSFFFFFFKSLQLFWMFGGGQTSQNATCWRSDPHDTSGLGVMHINDYCFFQKPSLQADRKETFHSSVVRIKSSYMHDKQTEGIIQSCKNQWLTVWYWTVCKGLALIGTIPQRHGHNYLKD